MRIVLGAAAILVAVIIGAGAFIVYQGTTASNAEPYGEPFTLVDGDNQTVTEQALRGHPSVLFFGFTHCPEVCPTTLYEMDGWLGQLADEGRTIKAYFVSIDPERDTPEIMKTYVGNVSDKITGLTGNPERVAAMAKSFGIFVRKVPLENDDYTMDHTASVILLDSSGDFFGTIAYGESSSTAIAKLKRLAGS